jgi:hypothetical protein
MEVPPGPQLPLVGTPPRRPGSVRRTTTIEQRRDGRRDPQEIVACGRDLRTRVDGTAEVLDAVTVRATVDATGTLTAIAADPPSPELGGLLGTHASRGLRARIDELLPAHRAGATLLHQLLDDFPMAGLLSGYGFSREETQFRLPPDTGARLTDQCAGWVAGGSMLDELDRTGFLPIPVGPPAPDLLSDDDPVAWHDLPTMAPRSARRWRRIDLLPGLPLEVDVHFRDTHLGADGLEDVLHEYTLAATVDPAELTVLAAEATVRVLPWMECPSAVASAGRVAGQRVADLRHVVPAELTGTSTCTHLNDLLRALSGLVALAPAVGG